ncbi:MAG: hypothetical protein GH148_01335 [Clostridia bacterium]|nr:hypothetical protein [Clostridia bacterium]
MIKSNKDIIAKTRENIFGKQKVRRSVKATDRKNKVVIKLPVFFLFEKSIK